MIYFGRRLNAPDGKFLGIIHVGMSLDNYHSIYSAISALRDKNMLLLRRDGTLLVGFPGDANRIASERIAADSPWYGNVAAGGGAFLSARLLRRRGRLVAVHPLDDYPLVVDVAVSAGRGARALARLGASDQRRRVSRPCLRRISGARRFRPVPPLAAIRGFAGGEGARSRGTERALRQRARQHAARRRAVRGRSPV